MLWRLLFPSWAFFDVITDVPRLEIRDVGEVGEWRSVLHAPARRWWSVIYHPEGTAHLVLQSVVDRLAVEQESAIRDDVTIGLVTAIALWYVQQRGHSLPTGGTASAMWQWRIVAVEALHPHPVRTIYESAPQAYPA